MTPPSHAAEVETPSSVDYARLSASLAALNYPLRLELLDHLRDPKTLNELRVSPQRGSGGIERAAARETVREHLDKLVEVGLVRVDTVEVESRTANRYTVNAPKLYEVTEEIRRLATRHAGRGEAADATGTLSDGTLAPRALGPRLVLVHGVYEGRAYPLTAATIRTGRWVVGRRNGLAVSLDYDPFVSLENSAVEERSGRFAVLDLPESKNGTAVNWELLPKGGERELRAGDVIGVGRSLLVFVPE